VKAVKPFFSFLVSVSKKKIKKKKTKSTIFFPEIEKERRRGRGGGKGKTSPWHVVGWPGGTCAQLARGMREGPEQAPRQSRSDCCRARPFGGVRWSRDRARDRAAAPARSTALPCPSGCPGPTAPSSSKLVRVSWQIKLFQVNDTSSSVWQPACVCSALPCHRAPGAFSCLAFWI